jgi:hypothetical protein
VAGEKRRRAADGLKGIAAELERLWSRPVSIYTVERLMKRRRDPLPVLTPKHARVSISTRKLSEWAKRQNQRVPTTEHSQFQLLLPLRGR